ncbi:hypothetical protein [Streptomyces racemochromogenes]|uniref:hypothetical protein n=1 Tax=Streptomyces racemochromogenes TaxID=67353 RepID=UPI0031EA813F
MLFTHTCAFRVYFARPVVPTVRRPEPSRLPAVFHSARAVIPDAALPPPEFLDTRRIKEGSE